MKCRILEFLLIFLRALCGSAAVIAFVYASVFSMQVSGFIDVSLSSDAEEKMIHFVFICLIFSIGYVINSLLDDKVSAKRKSLDNGVAPVSHSGTE